MATSRDFRESAIGRLRNAWAINEQARTQSASASPSDEAQDLAVPAGASDGSAVSWRPVRIGGGPEATGRNHFSRSCKLAND